MITYANGTKLSNMMFWHLGISYKTKVATYLSQQPTENVATFEGKKKTNSNSFI
jgi:hypothetical protein